MSRRALLFDLDGTLTDPAEGIIGGVSYALAQENLPLPDRAVLESFIGPPLLTQFQEVCGVDVAQAAHMVTSYRTYFVPRGMRENRVYDGIPTVLDTLRAAGYTLLVATSKPEPFAEEILDMFGLLSQFDYVCGSTLDETRTKKEEVIAYALARAGLTPEETVMVGDRCYDVLGAAAFGIPCVGVLYGYGSKEELTAAGATVLADSPAALTPTLFASL